MNDEQIMESTEASVNINQQIQRGIDNASVAQFDKQLENVRTIGDLSRFISIYSGVKNATTLQNIASTLTTVTKKIYQHEVINKQQVIDFLNVVKKVSNDNRGSEQGKKEINRILPEIMNEVKQFHEDLFNKTMKEIEDEEKLEQFKTSLKISNLPEDRKNGLLQKYMQRFEKEQVKVMKFSASKPIVSVDKNEMSKFKHTAKSSFKVRNIKC